MTAKRIRLNGLRQNTVGHTAMGLWRHPDSQAHRYRELSHWLDTAQILERGKEVADLDGFNIAAPVPLGDFVQLVVPELQRRGRVWADYEGSTLRERFRGPGQRLVSDDHPAAAYRQRRLTPTTQGKTDAL